MFRRFLPVVLSGALVLASCVDDQPTQIDRSGEIPAELLETSLSILDGNNGDQEERNDHFFWLRPLSDVRPNSFDGVVRTDLEPTLEICLRNAAGDGCADGPALVSFERDEGEDRNRLQIDENGHYYAHWRMKDFPPDRDAVYRIRVTLQSQEFGHADVIVLRQREIRAYGAPTGDAILPISDRGAFKITFRLEEGVLESQFCDFDGDGDVQDCEAGVEKAGDGIDTEVDVTATNADGEEVVAAKVTAPDGVFEDANGDPIENVVLTAEVELLPPSEDVFLNNDQELPFFVEINTFPEDVFIDPNGPGVTVTICQDEAVLADRGITTLDLMFELILYKVTDPKPGFPDGETKRLTSTFGAPECGATPIPAPSPQGIASLIGAGFTKLLSFVGPEPLKARRLHGGMNTVVRRDATSDAAFSTFGATPGPNGDSTTAVLPATGTVGTPVPILVEVKDGLGDPLSFGGDSVQVNFLSGPNVGQPVTVTDNENGTYDVAYTPTVSGIDQIEIVLLRRDNDTTSLGPISGSPFNLPILGTGVTNTNDAGQGSLRSAMQVANTIAGPNTITFAIPGAGPHLIAPATALPDITDAVTIDATTQAGYAGTPVVEVDGSAVPIGPLVGHGFAVLSSDVTIRGFSITNHPRSGVFALQNTSNVLVEDNHIGVDPSGTTAKGNAVAGLRFRANNSLIQNNVISGNGTDGIALDVDAGGTEVRANIIGLAANGVDLLGNGLDGVAVFNGPSGVLINDNVIAGNDRYGVHLPAGSSQVTGTVIVGNDIGVDVNGNLVRKDPTDLVDGSVNFGPASRGNAAGGVRVVDAPGTVIESNIISGNGTAGGPGTGAGISLEGPAVAPATVVRGNTIGLDQSGGAARGNVGNGITVATDGVVVGGPNPGDRNVISGNLSDGVETAGASGVLIEGNWVGLDATGTVGRGNGFYFGPLNEGCCHTGIFVRSGGHTVRGNVVSANWLGIRSGDPSGAANVIENNLVGTDPTGTLDLGNLTDGIGLFGDTSGTVIRGNTIRFTGGNGVSLTEGTEDAVLGGTGPGDGNVISDNGGSGVGIGDATDLRNTIRGNQIFDNGFVGIDLNGDGITANDPLDADAGANGLVNRPELIAANNGVVPGATQLQLRLNAAPGTVYDVEFFANASCDPLGSGEGETPLLVAGSAATDGSGQLVYSVNLPGVADGTVLTATATDPAGNTSEFSECVTAVAVSTADINVILPDTAAAGSGQMITLQGTGFPLTPDVTFTQGATTLTGFVFAASATQIVARLPASGLASSPGGVPTAVRVDTAGIVSNAVTIQVRDTPGTPLIVELYEADWTPLAPPPADQCGGPISVSDGDLLIDASDAIAVQAHGLDTSGSEIRLTQGADSWILTPTCGFFAPVAVIAPLPTTTDPGSSGGFLTDGPGEVQVRTTVSGSQSAWSSPVAVDIFVP